MQEKNEDVALIKGLLPVNLSNSAARIERTLVLALGIEKALSVLVIRSVGNQTMICKYISEMGV